MCAWSLAIAAVAIVVVNLTVARLPTMLPADGNYISLRGKDIHYIEQPGQSVPVVLLHGQPGTYKDFEKLITELPGLHVIAIDRPGYGWSRGGWMPYQDEIDLVHELLTQLKLVHRVDVDGTACYEPADPSGDHHHHAICERCGKRDAFEDPELERLIDDVAARLGYDVGAHDIVLRGSCPDCATR